MIVWSYCSMRGQKNSRMNDGSGSFSFKSGSGTQAQKDTLQLMQVGLLQRLSFENWKKSTSGVDCAKLADHAKLHWQNCRRFPSRMNIGAYSLSLLHREVAGPVCCLRRLGHTNSTRGLLRE